MVTCNCLKGRLVVSMSKKVKYLVIIGLLLLLSSANLVIYYFYFKNISIETIDYTYQDDKIYATIVFKNNLSGSCSYEGAYALIESKTCILEVPNEEQEIQIMTKWSIKNIQINPDLHEVLSLSIENGNMYLAVGEEKKVEVKTTQIGNPDISYVLKSENEEIVKIKENKLIGVAKGETTVSVVLGNLKEEFNVIVTDLITTPILTKKKKSLPCNYYSESDAKLLDEILKYKVNEAGYKTRGGVVAALRFLTLEFPFKIDYFFENGRLNNNTGGRYVDAEGRFYHEGLYLSSTKFSILDKNSNGWGPAIWGCPLMNWEDDGKFKPYTKYPNGLDCSGAVTWALYQAGFNPLDTGAGINKEYHDGLGDIGPQIKITRELLESNTLKAGDYIGSEWHAGLIGGITDTHVYVFESTTYYDGLVMHEYTFDELLDSYFLSYVIKMDDYYEEEGNYTNYWA